MAACPLSIPGYAYSIATGSRSPLAIRRIINETCLPGTRHHGMWYCLGWNLYLQSDDHARSERDQLRRWESVLQSAVLLYHSDPVAGRRYSLPVRLPLTTVP